MRPRQGRLSGAGTASRQTGPGRSGRDAFYRVHATLLAATGFTNKNLRVLIAGLLGSTYTPGQMTYDLRRLRLGGLIRRLPHTNRYVLTADGIRIAVFYTKVYNRLLVPLTAANQPQAPPDLRAALAAITRHVDDYASRARLPRAA